MTTPTEMSDRHSRVLAELSELGLALARDLQGRALAAEEPCDLALAFHRVSRSVRQTLALEARLERERRSAEREAGDAAAREARVWLSRRRAQVRLAVTHTIWNEAEGDEAETLLEDLEMRLVEEVLDEDFTALPLDACIERIREDLGLAAAATEAPREPQAHNDPALTPGDCPPRRSSG